METWCEGPCVLTRQLSPSLRPHPGADQPNTAWCWCTTLQPVRASVNSLVSVVWAHNEANKMPAQSHRTYHPVSDCAAVCSAAPLSSSIPRLRADTKGRLSVHLQRRGAKWAPILAQILPKLLSLFQSGLRRGRPVCTGAARDKMTASLQQGLAPLVWL